MQSFEIYCICSGFWKRLVMKVWITYSRHILTSLPTHNAFSLCPRVLGTSPLHSWVRHTERLFRREALRVSTQNVQSTIVSLVSIPTAAIVSTVLWHISRITAIVFSRSPFSVVVKRIEWNPKRQTSVGIPSLSRMVSTRLMLRCLRMWRTRFPTGGYCKKYNYLLLLTTVRTVWLTDGLNDFHKPCVTVNQRHYWTML